MQDKTIKIFLGVLVIGTVLMFGAYFAVPFIKQNFQASTSDASNTKGVIKVGVDSWVGYFPLCSNHMKNRMRTDGYVFECVDDKANYEERMENLKEGNLQFAVATVDSYLLNGGKEDFPGTIVTVIDESKGGDAIVARKDKIDSLDTMKKKKDYKVAFTPSSPSEHLLKSVAEHFDIPRLNKSSDAWKVETEGSTQAYNNLVKGKVDVAVLWEPDVSKAISDKKFIKILGTEDTHNLIVDILLVEREFSKNKEDVVKVVLSNYYRTLKHYRNNLKVLKEDLEDHTDLSSDKVDAMLKGVKWFTMYDNASKWFGVTNKTGYKNIGLANTIENTVDILINSGDFRKNPIPNNDSLVLVNSFFVDNLFNKGLSNQFGANNKNSSEDEFEFTPLASDRWDDLRPVGTLKLRPISFQSGTDEIDSLGELELEKIVKNLKHYPHFRIFIKGHTGVTGDPKVNIKLSQDRADTVKKYLVKTLKVNPYRIHSVGYGGDKPLPRLQNESYRSWKYKLPRVELVLVDEVY